MILSHSTPGARPLNACHQCGATAYKDVIERDAQGVMRATGRYQCVQCKFTFTDVREWRGSDLPSPSVPMDLIDPMAPVAAN